MFSSKLIFKSNLNTSKYIHLVGDLDGAVSLQAGITSQCPSDVSPIYHSRLKT